MLTMLRLATEYLENRSDQNSFPLPGTTKSICRMATGRGALSHLIKCLPKITANIVLLPCYVAEGVLKPFVDAGFRVHFYRLTPNLQPDERDVSRLLSEVGDKIVFMLIHFFGFPSASNSLLDMLTKRNAWVVSDCAQAPLSLSVQGTALGDLGDFALYSLNKWLPVCDNAILVSTTLDVSVSGFDAIPPPLPGEARDAYKCHLLAARKFFSTRCPTTAARLLQTIETEYEKYYRIINNTMIPYGPSDEALRVEQLFQYTHSAQTRRLYADRLMRELRSSSIILLHSAIPKNTIPLCVPARVSASRRIEILKILFNRGVHLSTLEEKWDFVPQGKHEYFRVESRFLKEHVLIPISEFMAESDMSHLIAELNRIN